MLLYRKNFLAACLLASGPLLADIVDLSVWRRETAAGEKQYLFLCGDIHDQLEIGFKQSQELVAFCKKIFKPGDALIVEDLNDVQMLQQRMDCFYNQYPHEQNRQAMKKNLLRSHEKDQALRKSDIEKCSHELLFILPYLSRQAGLETKNVDFRLVMHTGGPRLVIDHYAQGEKIVPFVFRQLYQEIVDFNDGELLKKWYAERLLRYKPYMDFVCNIMEKERLAFQDLPAYLAKKLDASPYDYRLVFPEGVLEPVYDYYHGQLQELLAKIKAGENRAGNLEELEDLMKDMLNFASIELIDCAILHEIYLRQIGASKAGKLVVCAGSAHTSGITPALPMLGYECIESHYVLAGASIDHLFASYMA